MDSVLGGRASEAKDEDLRLCLSSAILHLQDRTSYGACGESSDFSQSQVSPLNIENNDSQHRAEL